MIEFTDIFNLYNVPTRNRASRVRIGSGFLLKLRFRVLLAAVTLPRRYEKKNPPGTGKSFKTTSYRVFFGERIMYQIQAS